MSDLPALLRCCKESPDDLPRLVLADWLEEHGNAERAEFIRVQVELARLGFGDSRFAELRDRETALFKRNEGQWLGPCARYGSFRHGSFRRGLVNIGCDGSRLAELKRSLSAAGGEPVQAWVQSLTISNARMETYRVVDLLEKSRWLDSVTLSFAESWIGDGEVEFLASSPEMARVTRLNLYNEYVGDQGAAALAASPHLAHLTWLSLCDNHIGEAGAAALADSPYLSRLTDLELRGNPIGEEGKARLRLRYGDVVKLF